MDGTGRGQAESLRGGPVIPAGLPHPDRTPAGGPHPDRPPAGGPPPADIVIAPAHPASQSTEIVFEVRQAADGTPVLPVFSSVRQLVEVLGEAQPWVALPLNRARELAAGGGVREVVLDPHLLPGAWRWRPQDLGALAQELGDAQPSGTPPEVGPR